MSKNRPSQVQSAPIVNEVPHLSKLTKFRLNLKMSYVDSQLKIGIVPFHASIQFSSENTTEHFHWSSLIPPVTFLTQIHANLRNSNACNALTLLHQQLKTKLKTRILPVERGAKSSQGRMRTSYPVKRVLKGLEIHTPTPDNPSAGKPSGNYEKYS